MSKKQEEHLEDIEEALDNPDLPDDWRDYYEELADRLEDAIEQGKGTEDE